MHLQHQKEKKQQQELTRNLTNIDALCVTPRNIERQDYFGSFFELLKKLPEVTGSRAVEEALVPVVKMNFDGIKIDLLFARLALKELPHNFDQRDDMLLKNLDPKLVRSLNGCRATDEILRLMPNIDNFRLAINIWVFFFSLYLSVFRAWNLLQLFGLLWGCVVGYAYGQDVSAPECRRGHAGAQVLYGVFALEVAPVGFPEVARHRESGLSSVLSAVSVHLMPIITPAYPQQNSTFHVNPKCFEQQEQNQKDDGGEGADNTLVHIKVLETTRNGMKIEARQFRRKQLNQYFDPNLLKRERKNQRLRRRRKCANDLLRKNRNPILNTHKFSKCSRNLVRPLSLLKKFARFFHWG
ncbi:poly(A) polymerase type 3-like [Culex pipiens pallens]|uniref:poly(A) polymerase type 3-like n=1 Tax=Culex pipiens pallens TaxID=42434 RepID=UPI001953DAD6|nr:poly(A) polymerase type 3-like [Culex pipiens pallens]